ncbi:MAG: PP2C family protein-serine/threonine phosphatase, partial [Planctomycetota bacterium]
LHRTAFLEKGLDNAQKCVLRFLPSKAPEVQGYEFGFAYKSCEKVGGDFFDFVPLDDDHLGILIGDVSGHGLDAAILMGISKKVLHLRASEAGSASPREALARANRDLAPDFDRYSFVTVLYGILEFSTGRFTFSRAGHEPPVVFGRDAPPRVLESRGGALGARLEKGGGFVLEDRSVDLTAGEYVFLYTDGLPELRNARGALYTRDRLVFSLGQVIPEFTCPDALDAILRSAQEFAEGAPQEDDITTILVCRRESGR